MTEPPTRPAPRQSKAERTKESILAVAEELFSEHGYDSTTLDAIGELAGIQGSAILYHYSTKRELYEAVLDRIFTPFVNGLFAVLDGHGSLEERLVAITSTMVRFAAGRPSAARLILREATTGSAEVQDLLGRVTTRHQKRFIDALAAEGANGMPVDPLIVWNIIVGAICFYFSAGDTVGGLTGEAIAPVRVDRFEDVMTSLIRTLFVPPAN